MTSLRLEEFIGLNRKELIHRCRSKVAERTLPLPRQAENDYGVPRLLDLVVEELRDGVSSTDQINSSSVRHGHDLFLTGFTVGQVVHGYGDICQAVTELAVELGAPIDADDFRTLNRCLDDAIAGAVTEYARAQSATAAIRHGSSLDVASLADTAIVAFEALLRGNVGVGGSTGGLLLRSLKAIRTLADPAVPGNGSPESAARSQAAVSTAGWRRR